MTNSKESLNGIICIDCGKTTMPGDYHMPGCPKLSTKAAIAAMDAVQKSDTQDEQNNIQLLLISLENNGKRIAELMQEKEEIKGALKNAGDFITNIQPSLSGANAQAGRETLEVITGALQ